MLFPGCARLRCSGCTCAMWTSAAGWVRVTGKGDKERRVPLDPDVAGADPGLPARRASRDVVAAAVRRGQGPAPGPAADRGRAAHRLPLPPAAHRGGGWPSACAAPHLRHRPGRGRGGSGGDAGADGPRSRRLRPRPTSTWPPLTSGRSSMPRVPGSVPAHRAELFAEFLSYLERTGRCYILYQEAARQFLVRWPDPCRLGRPPAGRPARRRCAPAALRDVLDAARLPASWI